MTVKMVLWKKGDISEFNVHLKWRALGLSTAEWIRKMCMCHLQLVTLVYQRHFGMQCSLALEKHPQSVHICFS